jgi:anti-sigma28 factor (negative regulator of flagellin synthesis)
MNISGINGLNTIQPTIPTTARAADQATAASSQGVQVQLSNQASWVSQVRSEASQTPNVRMDEVSRAQQEIANGTLEGNIDMDAVLNALMMEL